MNIKWLGNHATVKHLGRYIGSASITNSGSCFVTWIEDDCLNSRLIVGWDCQQELNDSIKDVLLVCR